MKRAHLREDMLWLAIALGVMFAACIVVAALDDMEAGGRSDSVIMVAYGLTAERPGRSDADVSAELTDPHAVDKPVEVKRPANPWGVPLYREA